MRPGQYRLFDPQAYLYLPFPPTYFYLQAVSTSKTPRQASSRRTLATRSISSTRAAAWSNAAIDRA